MPSRARPRRPRPQCEPLNESATLDELARLPAYYMRHWQPRSVSLAESSRTYASLAGWGRTRFQIVGGQLYYPDLKHNTFGCVLRRTPIMAWALLQTLARHPDTPDVDIPLNCRDKPGSFLLPREGEGVGTVAAAKPALAFSYTTSRRYSDAPLPDYTYWGLPYVELPPWDAWLEATRDESRRCRHRLTPDLLQTYV